MCSSKNIFFLTKMDLLKEIKTNDIFGILSRFPYLENKLVRAVFYLLSILSTCILMVSFITLIPRHNSIVEPSYWFEIILPQSVGLLLKTTMMILSCSILTETNSFVSARFFLKIYLSIFLVWVLCYFISNSFWTIFLKHNYPMPLVGLICYYPIPIGSILFLLVLIPADLRSAREFKEKLKMFILYEFGWILSGFIRQVLSFIFRSLEDTDLQCLMAIVIPATKMVTKLILSKVMNRIDRSEKEKGNVLLGAHVNFVFGLFVATKLTGSRISTVICICGVEFLLQFKMGYEITRLKKKIDVHENENLQMEKRRASMKLVLAELCEGLTPLAYAFSFAMSYFGPNARLMGNVGSGIWHYKAVDDVVRTFMVLIGMFIIDMISLILIATFIWIRANFNIFQEFYRALQNHWYILVILLSNTNYFYFFSNDINNALDMTFQFCWTLKEQKYNKTCEAFDTW